MHATKNRDIDATPLAEIDVSRPELFLNDTWQPWFERLRKEAPVHYLADSVNGPFWSVTSHEMIKAVDTNNEVFSSEANFLLIRVREQNSAKGLYQHLLSQSLLVRNCGNFRGLDESFFRISLRTRWENQKLLDSMAEYFSP